MEPNKDEVIQKVRDNIFYLNEIFSPHGMFPEFLEVLSNEDGYGSSYKGSTEFTVYFTDPNKNVGIERFDYIKISTCYDRSFNNLKILTIYISHCSYLHTVNNKYGTFSLDLTISSDGGLRGKEYKLPNVEYEFFSTAKLIQNIIRVLRSEIFDTDSIKQVEKTICTLDSMIGYKKDTLRNKCIFVASWEWDIQFDNVPIHIQEEIKCAQKQHIDPSFFWI